MTPKQFSKKLNDIQKRYEKNFKEIVQVAKSPQFLQPIAVIAADLIRKRTRLGYGVNEEGAERKRLKALRPSYIDFRKGKVAFYTSKLGHVYPVTRNIKKPILSEFTTATRSNLTFTGQLLDSLKGRTTTRGIVVYLDPRRVGSKLTNAQIKDYQEKQGRSFFYLSRTETINVERVYRLKIIEELKKRFVLVR
jgi:hypothetical protein